jgi:hypothetical protein
MTKKMTMKAAVAKQMAQLNANKAQITAHQAQVAAYQASNNQYFGTVVGTGGISANVVASNNISCGTLVTSNYTAWPTANYTISTDDYYKIANSEQYESFLLKNGKIVVRDGREYDFLLKDGTRIIVEADGKYRIEDKDAKVTYKANNIREFNPFVNSSDLLAEFIRYLGTLNVKRSEVTSLPIGLFISWLIIRAAEADRDPIPEDVVPVPQHKLLKARIHPQCNNCHKFIKRISATSGFLYCNPLCAEKHFLQLKAA